MGKAFGIINFGGNHVHVKGLQDHRPLGAFSFLGRYRAIDFPISNLSNSGIDQIQVYVRRQPRSLVEHIGTGRHYNINSKRGKLYKMFADNSVGDDIYNNDISSFAKNIDCIKSMHEPYVVIVPSYMIFVQDFKLLLKKHIESGADITTLYHEVDNADTAYPNCFTLDINRQNGVLGIEPNHGNEARKNIFMDTYIMKKELFLELIEKAQAYSSLYTLIDIVNEECKDLDIRGISHKGYFATITDFKSYFDANISLIDFDNAESLFDPSWPIYTKTNDSCPTQYFASANVSDSVISNGCLIEGNIHHSVIGRGCVIEKGAVIENSVILPGAVISEDAHIVNQVVDKKAKILHKKEIIADIDNPGYIKRGDVL